VERDVEDFRGIWLYQTKLGLGWSTRGLLEKLPDAKVLDGRDRVVNGRKLLLWDGSLQAGWTCERHTRLFSQR